jgi:hypothetical protein
MTGGTPAADPKSFGGKDLRRLVLIEKQEDQPKQ